MSKPEDNGDEGRNIRFVDTSQEDVLKSKNVNELRPFYAGSLVNDRMTRVRESIYKIRYEWHRYDEFMSALKRELLKVDSNLSDDERKLFEAKKDWQDTPIEQSAVVADEELAATYDTLNLYTTQSGYRHIFSMINNVFRDDASVDSDDVILSAVFLIELFNIDLYNMCQQHPQYQNFDGVVYRGMALPEDVFETFENLLTQPLGNRYISVPLGLWSSSKEYSVAEKFITDTLKDHPSYLPLVMKINVLNLDPYHLARYRKRFEHRSVVSSICAVDITKLSAFQEESEVILRGGFYQALNLYDGEAICGRRCRVLELVMLNSNRDHISNPTLLGDDDAAARTMFGTMVGVTRNAFALDYCKRHSRNSDAVLYEKLLSDGREKLGKILTEC